MIKRRQEMRVEPRFEVKGGKGPYDTLHIWEKTEIDKINLCGVNTCLPAARSACIPTMRTERST